MALNTFKTNTAKGHMDNTSAVLLRSAIVDSALVGTFAAGTAVKLSGYEAGSVVTPITASTDDIYGFVPYTSKKGEFEAKDVVRVVLDNCVMVMEASAAIVIGAKVEIDPATMKIATLTTGSLVGTALQNAAADGDLVKIELKR